MQFLRHNISSPRVRNISSPNVRNRACTVPGISLVANASSHRRFFIGTSDAHALDHASVTCIPRGACGLPHPSTSSTGHSGTHTLAPTRAASPASLPLGMAPNHVGCVHQSVHVHAYPPVDTTGHAVLRLPRFTLSTQTSSVHLLVDPSPWRPRH